jgi:PTS system nitrogen regulatory IIA component
MQLTVREVSKVLDVSEATVNRWIKQRRLPAHHVAGQYRFNRAELLEWATAQGIKVSVELFDNLDTEDTDAVPSIAEALEAGGIFYGMKETSKEQALRALVGLLPLPEGADRELLLRLFLAREAAASTGIGNGIALPHVRNPIVLNVSRPMIALAFLEKAIEFGALDGRPVHVLFSLISPTTRSHLQMISRLSFALHDSSFRDTVLRVSPREEVLAAARRVEAVIGAPPPATGKAGH